MLSFSLLSPNAHTYARTHTQTNTFEVWKSFWYKKEFQKHFRWPYNIQCTNKQAKITKHIHEDQQQSWHALAINCTMATNVVTFRHINNMHTALAVTFVKLWCWRKHAYSRRMCGCQIGVIESLLKYLC